ncbi:MAG TPA: hypothetical protein VKR54_04490 [Candidatus Babeliales bacterium]|nr:hypothetical protein [Candidatus Babeliales bacterium]
MNIKYMILCSFLFVFSLNSMSPVDEYEHAREELKKCDNSWSALLYGCDEQRAAFHTIKNHLQRPFNEILEQTKDNNKVLSEAYDENINFLDTSIREKYLAKEKVHGESSLRYQMAHVIKNTIDYDEVEQPWYIKWGFWHVCNEDCSGRSSIDNKMIRKTEKLLKALDPIHNKYEKRYIRHCLLSSNDNKHIFYFLRPENAHNINQVTEEMKKEINKLQTKNSVQ